MSPNKSKAQQRYFQYLENQGKMPKKMANEFDDSTGFGHFPEEMHHYDKGGMVSENFDEEMGEAEEYDSSGEPHTEDELEDRHPMEFMSRGGRVNRMAMGGRVRNPSFVKALRRSMY